MNPAVKSIVSVHGTGGGNRTEGRTKWWEGDSTYCARTIARLGQDFAFGQPFEWSGLNWENARRQAANELWLRLLLYESQKRPYHLIGHSHGGSVIWLTLIRSARENRKLNYLASWSTVGTPFLTFAATPTNWPLILATLLMGLGIAATGYAITPPLDELRYVYANATLLELSAALAPWAITVALFLAAATSIVVTFASQFRHRRQRIHRQAAASWYQDKWLGIWHGQDEPIAGLAATLDRPIGVTHRRAESYPAPWRWIGRTIDCMMADIPDELAWRQFVRRLQGNDLKASGLAAVGRYPLELDPGWPEVPPAIASAMLKEADSKAAFTLSGMRTLLGTAYETRTAKGMVLGAGKLLNWGELIHTSYFDSDELTALIADHIRTSDNQRTGTIADEGAFRRLEPIADKPPVSPRPWTPQRLRQAGAVLVLGAAALFFYLTIAISRSSIYPYTTQYQVDRVATAIHDQGVINIGANRYIGPIILKLMKLGQLADPLSILDKLAIDNGRFEASQAVAFDYGSNGQFDKVEGVINNVTNDPGSFRAIALRVMAIDGASRARKAIPDKLVQGAFDAVSQLTTTDRRTIQLKGSLSNALYRALRPELASALLAQLWKAAPNQYSCDHIGVGADRLRLPGAASFILDQCGNSPKLTPLSATRMQLLERAGRTEDARKLAALAPAATTLDQLASQITIELFRSDPGSINQQVEKLLPNLRVTRQEDLRRQCELAPASQGDLSAPVVLPISLHDYFRLAAIADAYTATSNGSYAEPLYAINERFLNLCLANAPLEEDDMEWAERILKLTDSAGATRVIFEPAFRLARSLEDAKQSDRALNAYSLLISSSHRVNPAMRREVLFRMRDLVLAKKPLDLGMLQDLVKQAELFDADLAAQFQRLVVYLLSTTTDVAARSEAHGVLASYTSSSRLAREVRIAAEGATEPVDLLRGYSAVLSAAIGQKTGVVNDPADLAIDDVICEAKC
jgi:hypothetical protein